ncbi:efflux RND transporter periplasmic adaptor subunit [Vitiosangium sp. GDMCC 1.1324]|uniref:efflux RND transporter periplasmic adaptor subunit n=1 Tax=Vitiosangium sp. (strain GDMCC 1.1324) TaxID=2138576 RepID=UPI000D351EC9|nr:efflux RND transporter periplasmic adaptor subunit [Vitiosangium sp. GDMCC 1.1324]PTL75244.1 efflux RND transporter periplasmic adaptor subunit [Vitiosangium sp. GDMCC 1.1324]
MKSLHVLLLCLLWVCACKRETAPHEEEQAHAPESEAHAHDGGEDEALVRIDPEMLRDLRVTTAPVQERPGGEGVTALGELGVNENAYAEVASPITARVLSLLASPGEQVKKGQSLVELQSPELGKARAALQAAQARASAARQAAERKRTLGAERIVAEKEVQATEAEAATAEAELAAARSALLALGVESQEAANGRGAAGFTLRSPLAGTVIERSALMGQMVEPSRTLFHIGDLSRLWLTVHAFERDAVRIQHGALARVTFAALPGKDFAAKVGFVGQRVDPASRTIPVRLELDNPDGMLRPGMSASAFIPLGEPGATVITVPAAALQRLEDGWFAFLPRSGDTFERRAVGRGRTLGGDVEVLSGLTPGEQVVVEGAFLLKAEVEKSRGQGEHHEH